MTEKDRRLVGLAQSTRSDHAYIDRLAAGAETREARRELDNLSHWAFKTAEAMEFDY